MSTFEWQNECAMSFWYSGDYVELPYGRIVAHYFKDSQNTIGVKAVILNLNPPYESVANFQTVQGAKLWIQDQFKGE